MDFLVTIGHLGKDTGAVSPYDSDDEAGIVIQQQERWVNTQQVIGMICAYIADSGVRPDIKFAVPKGQITNLAMGNAFIEVDDEYFSLKDRVKLANNLDRSLIEFHNNAAAFEARGAEIICYSERSKGYDMGLSIMARLEDAKIKNRGVKTLKELGRDLTIIKETRQPAIILEGGFLTSERDASNLDVDLDAWNEQYGTLVYKGVREFWMNNRIHG